MAGFHSNPIVDDVLELNGTKYKFNGQGWDKEVVETATKAELDAANVVAADQANTIASLNSNINNINSSISTDSERLAAVAALTAAYDTADKNLNDTLTSALGSKANADMSNVGSLPTAIATQLKGSTGAKGTTGSTGQNGSTGATGAKGSNGSNGANGATGATGPKGSNGSNGATGPQGPQGYTGPASTVAGPPGSTGPIGPVGPAGKTHFNQNTAPNAVVGDTWFDQDDGVYYAFVDDSGTGIWLDVSTAGAGAGGSGVGVTTTFVTLGTHTIEVPAGVNKVNVKAVAGGASGRFISTSYCGGQGPGGGAGAGINNQLSVNEGETITVVVGAGGAGGHNGTHRNGGTTSIKGAGTDLTLGGGAGQSGGTASGANASSASTGGSGSNNNAGGTSIFGAGTGDYCGSATAPTPSNKGAGGSGAGDWPSSRVGAGANGLVILEWTADVTV